VSDLYEDFTAKKKNMETLQARTKRDRRMKKALRADWRRSEAFTLPPPDEKYREGWDRIFGGKKDEDK